MMRKNNSDLLSNYAVLLQADKSKLAIHFYKKAMELAPYLDKSYFGLAKNLYSDGDYSAASTAMRLAAEKSWEQSTRNCIKQGQLQSGPDSRIERTPFTAPAQNKPFMSFSFSFDTLTQI